MSEAKDPPLVQLRQVHKSYRLGLVEVNALCGVDLDIDRGEFLAVVGASGAGKSTLMNLIGCIDRASSGTVMIGGVDVLSLTDVERSDLRNKTIGFVFQSFNLLPVLTVYENVELPMLANEVLSANARRERVMPLLQSVGLEALAKARPENLSGGQRQRVAIARALVNGPALVVADEPTANLDSSAAHMILDLMVKMNETTKATFVFSTHDEKVMRRVRRTVAIADGILS